MWKEVWVIMLVLAFMCLAISILLMFIWDIPNLIDELSGRKAKRQIRMLHELNSSTSTFDKLSTNEIYSGISSGSLFNEELGSTCEEEIKNYSNGNKYETDGDPSSEGSDSTSFIEGGLDEPTSCLDSPVSIKATGDLKVVILEEQSSL